MANNLAEFEDFGEQQAHRAKKEIDEGSKGVFKFPVGTTILRIIPAAKGQTYPWLEVWQHFLKRGEKTIVFNCPRKTDNMKDPCPACDEAFRLYNTDNPLDSTEAKKYWPKQKFLLAAIVRPKKGEEADYTPKIIPVGKQIMDQLLEIRKGNETDPDEPIPPRNITHPVKGWDVKIRRVGTKQEDTKYTATYRKGGQVPLIYSIDDNGDASPDYEKINNILENPVNLEGQVNLPADNKIRKLMSGGAASSEGTRQVGSGSGRGRTASDDSIEAEVVDDDNFEDDFED